MIPGEGEKIVKAELLCAVVDLPAKALLMNCNQYNGKFGCAICKAPGEMVNTDIMHTFRSRILDPYIVSFCCNIDMV